MFGTKIHEILKKALTNIELSTSTKAEDNFRQIFCSALYENISPTNVIIPSTVDAGGDVVIFDKIIEMKYCHPDKSVAHDDIIIDFEDLLSKKCDFLLIGLSLRHPRGTKNIELCDVIKLPKLNVTKPSDDYANKSHGTIKYNSTGIYFPFCEVMFPYTVPKGRGNQRTRYIDIEICNAIVRESFLKIGDNHISVDIFGSSEDGYIFALYSLAPGVDFTTSSTSILRRENISAKTTKKDINFCAVKTIASHKYKSRIVDAQSSFHLNAKYIFDLER